MVYGTFVGEIAPQERWVRGRNETNPNPRGEMTKIKVKTSKYAYISCF